jgi:hypothetical protein
VGGPEPPGALRAAAQDVGRAVGEAARAAAGPRPSRKRLRAALLDALEDRGYEPVESAEGEIQFRDCPFDALVDDHRELVGGTNLAHSDGILEGLGDAGSMPGWISSRVAAAWSSRRSHRGGGGRPPLQASSIAAAMTNRPTVNAHRTASSTTRRTASSHGVGRSHPTASAAAAAATVANVTGR